MFTSAGGFLGSTQNGETIDCYSTGEVSGDGSLGGFSGGNWGDIVECFWDTETSEQAASAAGTGKNTVQMKSQVTFAGWNFTTVWGIVDTDTEQSYPYLIL